MTRSENLRETFDALCVLAARETLARFRVGTSVTNKENGGFDPVTEADREAERAVRKLINEQFPNDGIHGEEFGATSGTSGYEWVIDPIDGTRAFISGLPLWGTLIGLYKDGVPYAGVMDQPFTGERYYGMPKSSFVAVRNGMPQTLQTSSCDSLELATLMTTDPNLFIDAADQTYFKMEKQVRLTRYGCDCYAYCMLAAGHVEIVIESGLNAYDIAALIPIIESAGGVVSTWDGGDPAQGGQILACANPRLQKQAMKVLSK